MLGEFLKMGDHIHAQIARLSGNTPRIVEGIYLSMGSGMALVSGAQEEVKAWKREKKEVIQFILMGSVPTEGFSSLWELV